MNTVKAQKMCVCFNRSKIVDRDNLNISAAAFDDGTQYIAADPAKSVNCNFDGHSLSS